MTDEERQTKVNNLVKALLEKDVLLRQYAMWLETSEKNTIHKGEDVYNMLKGAMHALSDVDFIPGTGSENFVEVIASVQRETGLDLGVCKYLHYNRNKTSECGRSEDILVASLDTCLPPQRCNCPYRKAALDDDDNEFNYLDF